MVKKRTDPEADRREALMVRARKNLKRAEDAEFKIRAERKEDLLFMAGEQWPEEIRNSRNADKRPCLTINRIPQFVQQIANDQKQNRPDISVDPVGSGADQETAEAFQGMIRHISYDSRGDVASDNAFMYAAACGDGYMRVIPEYESEDSFDQVLKIKQIADPDSVFLDPMSIEPDGSDSEFGFILDDLTKEEYEAAYPDSGVAQGIDMLTQFAAKAPQWFAGENIRVAEYYEKEYVEKTLYLLEDGRAVFADEKKDRDKVKDTRRTRVPTWKWYKLNGVEILEETEWKCPWLPIVRIKGQEIMADGELHRWGIIRFLRDPQRRYNYLRSAEAEVIALAPRVPYIVADGQLDGFETTWDQANNRNYAYLPYNPVSNEGQAAPPPQRQNFEANVQGLIGSAMQASEELKSVSGIYDDALGSGSQERSGKAIMARQTQSHSANYHLIDNYHKSLRYLGLILVSAIPNYYDTAREVRILQEDKTSKLIKLNEPYAEVNSEGKATGKIKHHDTSKGRYDVVIHAGPSYQTKRQEEAAWLQEAIRGNPQMFNIIGDILFQNMDLPGADQVSARLKKMLPPQLQDEDGKPQIPPQVQQQMHQQGQMIQQLTGALHQVQNKLDSKTLELESKERIADKQILMEAASVLATLKSKEATSLLEHQVGSIQHQLTMLGQDQEPQAPGAGPSPGGATQAPSPVNPPATGATPGPAPQGQGGPAPQPLGSSMGTP